MKTILSLIVCVILIVIAYVNFSSPDSYASSVQSNDNERVNSNNLVAKTAKDREEEQLTLTIDSNIDMMEDSENQEISDENIDTEEQDTINQELTAFELDDALEENTENIVFDSQQVDTLSLEDTQLLIQNLENQLFEASSQDVLNSINKALLDESQMNLPVNIDTYSCSDKLCGIMISADDEASIEASFSSFVEHPELKQSLKGGSMRVIKQGEMYYGVLISVINAHKPISIK